MKVSLIAAMDQQRGIGKNNDLLFRISEDLRRFKEITSGHPVIMGRKTYESIGRLLPNRTNIIVTRDPNYTIYEAVIAHSLEEAIEMAQKIEKERSGLGLDNKEEEIFVIGGGQMFEQAITLADKLYLTTVEGNYQADTFFPDYSGFKVVNEEEHESEGYTYKFLELQK